MSTQLDRFLKVRVDLCWAAWQSQRKLSKRLTDKKTTPGNRRLGSKMAGHGDDPYTSIRPIGDIDPSYSPHRRSKNSESVIRRCKCLRVGTRWQVNAASELLDESAENILWCLAHPAESSAIRRFTDLSKPWFHAGLKKKRAFTRREKTPPSRTLVIIETERSNRYYITSRESRNY